MRIWTCKIGAFSANDLPPGADGPMRDAIAIAFESVTTYTQDFIFSGWGGTLSEGERAVVENRPADLEKIVTESPDLLREKYDGELTAANARIAELEKERTAGRLMADFAKGAIHDAIATEDGLDGETGQGVMCIISEWQEHGTFDETKCEHMTSFEKFAATAIDEDAHFEIEGLKRQLADAPARIKALTELVELADKQKQRAWAAQGPLQSAIDTANARIAELESALMDKTLNKVDVRIQLDAAEKRIAALEALLAEAPHTPECDAFSVIETGYDHLKSVYDPDKCNCFKSRA